jgi:hypothetical protein
VQEAGHSLCWGKKPPLENSQDRPHHHTICSLCHLTLSSLWNPSRRVTMQKFALLRGSIQWDWSKTRTTKSPAISHGAPAWPVPAHWLSSKTISLDSRFGFSPPACTSTGSGNFRWGCNTCTNPGSWWLS